MSSQPRTISASPAFKAKPPAVRAARLLSALTLCVASGLAAATSDFTRIKHEDPGLIVDLGVGLWSWPMPMDYNRDGLVDLVVACTDKPYNGTYVFLNSGVVDPQTTLPIFRPGERIGSAEQNPQISYVNGQPVAMTPNRVYPDFLHSGFDRGEAVPAPEQIHIPEGPTREGTRMRIRANQWRQVDFDGDGAYDLIVGIGDWTDYGWDNAYDAAGRWTNGPLRGFVYVLRNTGTTSAPTYATPIKLEAGGQRIETFGMPSPSFADFDGDGDLDLVCGEFLDGFTYFQNEGSRTAPRYAAGQRLTNAGRPIAMSLCMITPVAYDFNGDGHMDLVVGDEDGRVALVEHSGVVSNGLPQFRQPRYFRQFAKHVKFGALSSPVSVDWDGDGLDDIVSGNTAGNIGFIKNLGGNPPRWAAPVYLSAGGETIRIMAGPNGSIQGPAETKWGYSNVSVADWDGDGRLDVLDLGIWGHVTFYRNIGTREQPMLAKGSKLTVAWEGPAPKPAWNWWQPTHGELVTQWRSTPYMIDLNQDRLMDLVTLDAEGYLAFFERYRGADGTLALKPPQRIFWAEGVSEFNSSGKPTKAGKNQAGLLRMNSGELGRSGRRTFCFVDWDGDGKLDLIMNSQPNASLLRGAGKNAKGQWVFRYEGPMGERLLAGHSTTPTIVDWENDGIPDLLLGAEDGFFYHLRNPRGRTE